LTPSEITEKITFAERMKINIRTYIKENAEKLNQQYEDPTESKAVCEQLLMHHLNCTRIELYAGNEFEISEKTLHILDKEFEKLFLNIPLQYIIGEVQFRNISLKINEGVLIPRPETEELLSLVIEHETLNTNLNILDACTGSGCIALSLKDEFPFLNLSAFDVDNTALELAKKNSKLLNIELEIYHYDLLNPHKSEGHGKFDIVISNPPYVLDSEKSLMSKRVLDFEPHKALFTVSNDPLLFYKKIIEQFSAKGTRFYFEINPLSINLFEEYLSALKMQYSIYKDMNEKTRFLKIILPKN
jgi:release factor glutamine methyltransferase